MKFKIEPTGKGRRVSTHGTTFFLSSSVLSSKAEYVIYQPKLVQCFYKSAGERTSDIDAAENLREAALSISALSTPVLDVPFVTRIR